MHVTRREKKARSAKSRREFETVNNSGDYFLRFSSFSEKLVGATSSGGFLVLRGIKELNQFHAIFSTSFEAVHN